MAERDELPKNPPRYSGFQQYPTGISYVVCDRCGATVHRDRIVKHDAFHTALAGLFEALQSLK